MRRPGPIAILTASLLLAAAAAADEPTSGEPKTSGELWLEAHRSPDQKTYFGEPIDLSLKDADLVEVLRSFAEIGGFNLIVQPGVQGRVTVALKGVPWDQALEAILKINNLGMDVTSGRMRVGSGAGYPHRALSSALVTVTLGLRYADPAIVARALHAAPGPSGALRAEAGQLVIRDTRPALQTFGRALAAIDVPSAAGEDPASLERRAVEAWEQAASESPGG